MSFSLQAEQIKGDVRRLADLAELEAVEARLRVAERRAVSSTDQFENERRDEAIATLAKRQRALIARLWGAAAVATERRERR